MLIISISEICDRYSIVKLKLERLEQQNEDLAAELESLKKEIENHQGGNNFNQDWLEKLYEINGKIWDLEFDIRRGKEKELGLEEVGRRAIAIRELNRKRVAVKNQIIRETGQGFQDVKINHASESTRRKLVLAITPARPGKRRKFTAPPIGLLYLGSYTKRLGYDVKIIDGDVEGYTLDGLAEKLVAENADLIGITVMTQFAADVLNLCKKIKKINPQAKICLGGIHVTATGTEIIEASPYVDYLVLGEGEHTLVELVEHIDGRQELKYIKGLVYRDEKTGQIIKNKPRPPIEDLDLLPDPDLSLIENLDFSNYHVIHAGNSKVVYILGSRGCPFLCAFCAAHLVHGRKVRFRSPKRVVDEIEYNQKKYGVSYVGFKDSTFTLSHVWVKELCEEIIGRKIKIGFAINARVDTVNQEILEIMKKAGCQTMGFGVESGSQRILDKLRKGTNLEQIREAQKIVNKFNFFTINSFMLGNPGDTKEDVEKTFKFAKSLKTTGAGFCPATAYPGTEIYYNALKDRVLKDPQWYLKKHPEHEYEFLPTGTYDGVLTFNDFNTEEEVKRAFNRFYLHPSYILSIVKKCIIHPVFFRYATGYAWGLLRQTFDNT